MANEEQGEEEPEERELLDPIQKVERKRKIEQELHTQILDKIYTRTLQRIREKKGMLRHKDAMRMVLKEDKQQILDEILNEAIDAIGKSYPLLAENLRSKDEKSERTRSVSFMR